MKFGLFGGARARGGPAGDSQGYHDFINYVIDAEELGFSSVFLVEHHFTGFGQVSASLNLLSYLAARTETHPSRHRGRRAAVAQSGAGRRAGRDARSAVERPARFRRRQGLPRRTSSPASASRRTRRPSGSTRRWTVIRKAWTSKGRFSHHGKWWHYDNIVVEPAPIQQPHPPFWLGAGSPEIDPPRRARGLQSAARPDRADRSDHRAGARSSARNAKRSAGPTIR